MSTTVTLTGTGVPHPSPGRAGPGVLVRVGDEVALQFDAGRGTVMRLSEAHMDPADLSAVFVTHVHSDHVADLADLAITHWVLQQFEERGPLEIVVPEGAAERFVRHMLDPYADDIAVRMAHAQPDPPEIRITTFSAPVEPTEVWRSNDGHVTVEAVAVHHEPVLDAVAYRITTPDGVVVVSGDTRVCVEVERLSRGADIVVHEACRASALREVIQGTRFEPIFDYHADTVGLGGLAERAGIRHLVLTHMIPAPEDPEQEVGYVDDVRKGGFTGKVTVGADLMTFDIESART